MKRRATPAAEADPSTYRKHAPQPPITKASDRPALTSAELTACQVVDGVLTGFVFTPPVELDDLAAVKGALLGALGAGFDVEIYHRYAIVVIRVYLHGAARALCERTLRVSASAT